MILFIQHIDIEGPDTFGGYLNQKGYHPMVLDLSEDQKLPDSPAGFEAVISLGGPMSAYEEDEYPFLKEEDDFIKKVLDAGVPFMGICLGSQLLAKACGAKIQKAPEKEIGFSAIQLTSEGKEDPLFAGIDGDIDVFQWHEDMFDIPESGTRLAESSTCPNQAFRVGQNAYGLQFHVEITDKSIRDWSHKYIKKDHPEFETRAQQMILEYQRRKMRFHNIAERIYENFLGVIETPQAAAS